MNDEEKKSFELLKTQISLLESGINFKTTDEFSRLNLKRMYEEILNLIKKQSKEIEGLKKQSKELIEKYDEELLEKNNYIFNLETEREALHKIIDESFE